MPPKLSVPPVISHWTCYIPGTGKKQIESLCLKEAAKKGFGRAIIRYPPHDTTIVEGKPVKCVWHITVDLVNDTTGEGEAVHIELTDKTSFIHTGTTVMGPADPANPPPAQPPKPPKQSRGTVPNPPKKAPKLAPDTPESLRSGDGKK
ncbi:MAG: hypothetical protein Q9163_002445 [Psora crenata]